MRYDGLDGSNSIGGIVGVLKNSNISNCYNWNSLLLNEYVGGKDTGVGGLVGISDRSSFENCHNKCKIEMNTDIDHGTLNLGTFCGLIVDYESRKVKNSSSLKYKDYDGFGKIGSNHEADYNEGLTLYEDESKMPDILEVLGESFAEGLNGYPILKWQIES